jgi:hypothetical protein
MESLLDLPYVSSDNPKAHSFDLHLPSSENNHGYTLPLVCFVHGGAWRSEDKADHVNLACALASFTGAAVAVPNYRLSPKTPQDGPPLLHPHHTLDILHFLEYIRTWDGPQHSSTRSGPLYDHTKIFLIGHSCSAHMLASIFLDSSAVTPELAPSPDLLSAVQGIVVSEGIYDLDVLLNSFPSYKDYFVDAAFGFGPSYAQYSVARYPLRAGASHVKWLVLHSKGDTLIDQRQSDMMLDHLRNLYSQSTNDSVSHNFTELDEEHDPLLSGSTYLNIVGTHLRSAFI